MKIIFALLFIVCLALLIYFMVKKLKFGGGCCGSTGGIEKKIRPNDRNKKHYPYVYIAKIDGMVCGNCANRVSNSLNRYEGIYASVDLFSKSAKILSKISLSPEDVRKYLKGTSYTLIEFKEEKNELK